MIILDELTCVLSSGRLKTTILQDVSVVLPTDGRLVVLAQEGAGKTSFLRLLSGAVLPTTGTITRHARVSFPVGYTGGYKRALSARENISHAARLYGADVDEVVAFVAAVTELEYAMEETFGDLPSQLMRRLAYAVSYAIPFDVYLLDDRISAGDPDFRVRCEYMFEQRARESGIILTSSIPRYARKYGRTGAILHNGALVLYDDLDKAIWDFERLDRRLLSVRPRGSESMREFDAAENDEG